MKVDLAKSDLERVDGTQLPHQNVYSGLIELVAAAEKLQEAAQALLAFCKANHSTQASIKGCAAVTETLPSNSEGRYESGETRCYRFSPAALRREHELLEEYKADDFCGLLFEAHISLAGLLKLMKNIDLSASLDGGTVYSLGCLLERSVSLMFKIQDVYSTVERVE